MRKDLSIIDVISTSWKIYKNNFNLFLQPITYLIISGVAFLIPSFFDFPFQTPLLIITLGAFIVINVWTSVIIFSICHELINKRKINLSEIYKNSWKRSPRFFWQSFVFGLIVIGGSILFILPGIYWSVKYGFVPYISSISEKKIYMGQALNESGDLVKGKWWSTFWNLLIPSMFFLLVAGVLTYGLAGTITGGLASYETLNENFFFNVLSTIISSLIGPLTSLPIAILYNNYLENKEV